MTDNLESAFALVHRSHPRRTGSHLALRSLQDSIHIAKRLMAESEQRIAPSGNLIAQLYGSGDAGAMEERVPRRSTTAAHTRCVPR